jgi:hypothetical protein
MAKFPWQSPYCGMDNNPILFNDIFGLEATSDYFDNKTGKKLGHVEDGKDDVFIISNEKWKALNNDLGTSKGSDGFYAAAIANYGARKLNAYDSDLYTSGAKERQYTASQRAKEMVRPENVPKPNTIVQNNNSSNSTSNQGSVSTNQVQNTGNTNFTGPQNNSPFDFLAITHKTQTQYEEVFIDGFLGDKVSITNFEGTTQKIKSVQNPLITINTTKTAGGGRSYSVKSGPITAGISGANLTLDLAIPFTDYSATFGTGPGYGLGEYQLGFKHTSSNGNYYGSRLNIRPGGGVGLTALGGVLIFVSGGELAPIIIPALRLVF